MVEKERNITQGSKSAYIETNYGTVIINPNGTEIPKYLTPPPLKSEVFIGREDDLKAVHDHLFQDDNSLLLLVNGQGGIGKTTLAAQYYHRYEQEYHHLAWVFADKSIADAILSLARDLKVSFPPNMPNKERLPLLLQAMQNLNKPCLLILDNTNDITDLAENYPLLRRCSKFHMLLTTRLTKFSQASFYAINPLAEKDALALFTRHYPQHQESEDKLLKSILKAIDRNTLVIELLAKNLNNFNNALKTRYTLADLLKDLQTKGVLALSKTNMVTTDYHDLKEATPEAIITAMYNLSDLSKEEIALLSVFAVLPAENIPFENLETLLPDRQEALDIHLLSLNQKGWINYEKHTQSFKCSPVIQEIIRTKNPSLYKNCQTLIKTLTEKLKKDTLHKENYKYSALFTHYAESVVAGFSKPINSFSRLYDRIGDYHKITGNINKTLEAFSKANKIDEHFYKNKPNSSTYKNNLAISYSKLGGIHITLGMLKTALNFFQKRKEIGKELYIDFPNNLDFKNGLAIAYQKLGSTHRKLGNLDMALDFFRKYNQLREELYSEVPNNVQFKYGLAISYQKLGDIHKKSENLDIAIDFFRKDNQLKEKLYKDFPNNLKFKYGLAISYQKLGGAYTQSGNLDIALDFFRKDNQLKEKLYKDFPNNVQFKNGLAIVYQKLGDTHTQLGNLDMALDFFRKCEEIGKELYKKFPNNVQFKNELAISYSKLGSFYRYKPDKIKAKEYYQKSYAIRKELLGKHPAYVDFQNNFAEVTNALTALDKTK